MTQTIAAAGQHSSPTRTRRMRRAAALVAAAVLALAVWAVAAAMFGVDLVAGTGATAQQVGPIAVAVAPLVAGGLAWALLALMEKTRHGRRIWLIIGWVFLAVSLLEPITMTASAAAMVTLLLMHLLVGATLIVGLSRAGRTA